MPNIFKSASLYRIRQGWPEGAASLAEQLQAQAFRPCGAMDSETHGFIPPVPDGELAYRSPSGQYLVTLCTEDKILPACVVNQVVQDRVKEIEDKEGYRPGRKQVREIKERVTDELLSKAFTRRKHTQAWIDPENGYLVVDTPNSSKADLVVEYMRKAGVEVPVSLFRTKRSPSGAMSQWLMDDEPPSGFTLDQDVELVADFEDKPKVKYTNKLEREEVVHHLQSGKLPTRLAMTYADRVSFVLGDDMTLRRIALLDGVMDNAEMAESAAEQFDADFTLFTEEMRRLLSALTEGMGGFEQDLADQGMQEGDPTPAEDRPVEFHGTAEEDPLYDTAKMIVLETGRPSISLVQRHLRIGYNRAARLIERMEKEGVVSAMDASGVRKVRN